MAVPKMCLELLSFLILTERLELYPCGHEDRTRVRVRVRVRETKMFWFPFSTAI